MRYVSWQSPGEFVVSRTGLTWVNRGFPDPDAIGDETNAVDSNGVVYNGQICGGGTALHTCIYRSPDQARHWPVKTMAADSHPGASDRPWIDVYPHAKRFHWKSSSCNTIPSGVVVDQYSSHKGTVYALWLSGNDATSNAVTGCNYSQIGPFNKAWVSVSHDGGTTWNAHLAWKGKFDPTTKIGDNADKIFGTISVDRSGQVHVLLPVRHRDDPVGYVKDCETNSNCKENYSPTDLLLVTSPDGGRHWTAPFKVNRIRGSHFFPWIAAGSRGRVDAIYFWSRTLRPNNSRDRWFIQFAQITRAVAKLAGHGAAYARRPIVRRATPDRRVQHHGGICTFGVFCAAVPHANRSLADSIAIAVDMGGGANAVWTNDTGKHSHIEFACQSSGPSAYVHRGHMHGCWVRRR
jgi:hypothetical protein